MGCLPGGARGAAGREGCGRLRRLRHHRQLQRCAWRRCVDQRTRQTSQNHRFQAQEGPRNLLRPSVKFAQILTRALGGKTGRAKGWDIGVTCIHPSHSALKLLSSLHIPSHLPVIECHRDEVWELPPHAEVIAWSEKTGIEMFRYGDHIMGIQGHPEYTKDILLHLIDRLLQRNLIQTRHAEAAKASLDAREPDREAWKKLCKSFLKGKL
ncbi:gamma-glutamyl peptidase 5 isoform X2 [Elaeis guineensis]|uniref:Gamma-glutamyl peptidase 5 isoform X2 n=1 Tax=Elaeis guineensis var. tenera TaxID=51953 RepID=A0A6J0PAZ0_ELAGV|nr:gamma-glutamyl peptidase 5 isoform X2 [Elaeis guineensis]